jgi:hypothetical protein
VTGDTRINPDVFGNYDVMPGNWKVLFVLLDIGRRFRWDTIDPVRSSLRHRLADAPKDEWAAEAQRVITSAKTLQRELMGIGMKGEEQFYGAFEAEIRASLMDRMARYPAVEKTYAKAIADGDYAKTLEELDRIAGFNKAFFEHTARQLHKLVTELS